MSSTTLYRILVEQKIGLRVLLGVNIALMLPELRGIFV